MNKFEIVTVCAHCGKLIHLQNDIFSSNIFKYKNSNLPPVIPFFNQKRKVNICFYNSLSFRFTKRLDCVQKLLTYNSVLFFPLCQDCTAIYCQQVIMMVDFLKTASNDLHTINITIPIEKMQDRIEQLTTLVSLNPKRKSLRKRRSAPELPKQAEKLIYEENENKKKESPPQNEIMSVNPITKLIRKQPVCPLISFYTFYISSDHHYGTINQNRIGFFKYNPNTLTENNTALFFLCHLIYYFKCKFRIPQIYVSLNPVSVIVNPNKNPDNINFSSYILEFPTKRNRVNEFNESLYFLFQAYSLICQASTKLRKIGEPPFQIDFNQKKIEKYSFILNWKNVEEWSKAMKLFLINLKMIQYRTLRGTLNQF